MWLRAKRDEEVLPRFGDNGFLKQKTNPQRGALNRCYHSECPGRIHVAFDDHRLVANTGLILPVTPAHHLAVDELVDCHVDLG